MSKKQAKSKAPKVDSRKGKAAKQDKTTSAKEVKETKAKKVAEAKEQPSESKPKKDEPRFIYDGGTVTSGSADNYLTPRIEPGVWKVVDVGEKGPVIALKRQDELKFEVPKKVFGDFETRFNKITEAFMAQDGSLGVLLAGEPGTGKTVLMKALSTWALDNDIPVIIIDDTFDLEQMFNLLDNEAGRCLIQFDEFDKVFEDSDVQSKMLTFFDGAVKRNFLNVICANNVDGLIQPLMVRPSRIHYKFTFKALTINDAKEVVEYRVKGKAKRDDLLKGIASLKHISYDTVVALINEVGRTGHKAEQAIIDMGMERKWFVPSLKEPEVSVEVFLDGRKQPITDMLNIDLNDLTENMVGGYGHSTVSADIKTDHAGYNDLFKGHTIMQTKTSANRVLGYGSDYVDLKVTFTHEEDEVPTLHGKMRVYRGDAF